MDNEPTIIPHAFLTRYVNMPLNSLIPLMKTKSMRIEDGVTTYLEGETSSFYESRIDVFRKDVLKYSILDSKIISAELSILYSDLLGHYPEREAEIKKVFNDIKADLFNSGFVIQLESKLAEKPKPLPVELSETPGIDRYLSTPPGLHYVLAVLTNNEPSGISDLRVSRAIISGLAWDKHTLEQLYKEELRVAGRKAVFDKLVELYRNAIKSYDLSKVERIELNGVDPEVASMAKSLMPMAQNYTEPSPYMPWEEDFWKKIFRVEQESKLQEKQKQQEEQKPDQDHFMFYAFCGCCNKRFLTTVLPGSGPAYCEECLDQRPWLKTGETKQQYELRLAGVKAQAPEKSQPSDISSPPPSTPKSKKKWWQFWK